MCDCASRVHPGIECMSTECHCHPKAFVKVPIEIEAIKYTGQNAGEIKWFVGDVIDRQQTTVGFQELRGPQIGGAHAQVYDSKVHHAWLPVRVGQWIIKGIKGEFYPCDDAVFQETYLPALDREPQDIRSELSSVLNRYSAESVSGTPDFILAEFLLDCLKGFNEAVSQRANWRGEPVEFSPSPE